MLTYKLKIKGNSNTQLLNDKIRQYSYAFRFLYNNFNQDDVDFILKHKFNLDTWQIVSLKLDVTAKLNQIQTFKGKMNDKLNNLMNYIPKNKKQAYAIYKKIKHCKCSLKSDIVFGGKINLLKLQNGQISKQQWKQLRLIPKFITGQNFQLHGNRKIKFQQNCFVYKVGKQKIKIECFIDKKRIKIISRLIQLTKENKLGLSYRISKDYIYLTFDEKYLNGYEQIKRTHWKKGDKEYNKDLILQRQNKLLENKKSNRYCGIDLNPQYIGISILDKLANEQFEIVTTKCFKLSNLNTSLKLSSDDEQQVKQNNKRKFQICNVWTDIFKTLIHYKVAYIVLQQLQFKQPLSKSKNKSFNKKCKNLWHLNLTTNLINKHCNLNGIQLIKINPAFSSFIGNIQHVYNDPVNASVQICRRGIVKFIKGKFYPEITETDKLVMSNLLNQVRNEFSQNALSQVKTWTYWYYLFKQLGIRYRRSLISNYKEFQFKTIKSKVKFITFYKF